MDGHETAHVLVIGGGPAGSTAATLLAREGFDVLLAEKDQFPRYHIGESLLPSVLEICDLIGAREKIEARGFVRKHGGYFSWGHDSWVLNFEQLRHPYGFQVVRSEFDQVLLEHAESQGVRVHQRTAIDGISFEGDRPRRASWRAHDGRRGEITFDYLIDASGRTGLMSTRYLKNRRVHEAFQEYCHLGLLARRGEHGIRSGWSHRGRLCTGRLAMGNPAPRWDDERGSGAASHHLSGEAAPVRLT